MAALRVERAGGNGVWSDVAKTHRRGLERYQQTGEARVLAHDFNNLLIVILGYTKLVAPRLPDDPPGLDDLEEIRRAGERAAELTRHLLAFSRRQVLEPRVLDVNLILEGMEKRLRRLIGEDIDVVTMLEPGLGRARADAGEIEQIIMNLAINSRDAMPQGGRITIETANVELDEDYAQRHAAAHPGRYIMLAVSDTGIGMDAAAQSCIFEPYLHDQGERQGNGSGAFRRSSGSSNQAGATSGSTASRAEERL